MNPGRSRAPPPLNLSNAIKLKYMKFRWDAWNIRWITAALETVQPETLQRITVFIRTSPVFTPTEGTLREWHELDHLLAKLRATHPILPRVLFKSALGGLAPRVLPELTRSGLA